MATNRVNRHALRRCPPGVDTLGATRTRQRNKEHSYERSSVPLLSRRTKTAVPSLRVPDLGGIEERTTHRSVQALA